MEESAVNTVRELHVMPRPEPQDGAGPGDGSAAGDVVLVAALFLLNVVPVVGEVVRPRHWSPGLVGFAAAAAILTGRELWSQVRARASARG
jgi:hypothetical protein